MEKSIEIKSVKLLKQRDGNGITLGTIERDSKGDAASGDKDHTAPVHPDLEAAIQTLTPHYKALTAGADYAGDTYVSGYSLSEKSKTLGFMLTGHFYNGRGKAVIANSPWEAFMGETAYEGMETLEVALKLIDQEVRSYLDGTKRGGQQTIPYVDPTQQKLNLEGNTYPNGPGNASPKAMARVSEGDKPKPRGSKQTASNPSGQGGRVGSTTHPCAF